MFYSWILFVYFFSSCRCRNAIWMHSTRRESLNFQKPTSCHRNFYRTLIIIAHFITETMTIFCKPINIPHLYCSTLYHKVCNCFLTIEDLPITSSISTKIVNLKRLSPEKLFANWSKNFFFENSQVDIVLVLLRCCLTVNEIFVWLFKWDGDWFDSVRFDSARVLLSATYCKKNWCVPTNWCRNSVIDAY